MGRGGGGVCAPSKKVTRLPGLCGGGGTGLTGDDGGGGSGYRGGNGGGMGTVGTQIHMKRAGCGNTGRTDGGSAATALLWLAMAVKAG